MSSINDALSALTQLFGAVVALAVFVVGFFLGRRWVRLASTDGVIEPSKRDLYKRWRSSGISPSEMRKMPGGWRSL